MNKTSSNWRYRFLDNLQLKNIFVQEYISLKSSNIITALIKPEGWKQAGHIAFSFDCRWVSIWAKHINATIQLSLCLELVGEYLLLRTNIAIEKPEIASWVSYYPAANRPERYIHDMFGVVFTDHPDFRRWIRHKAWNELQFPLRKDFMISGEQQSVETPPDADYLFLRVAGNGVCEVPVGPVHAGIIEPGHFRFQIAGEDILHLEERLGYVHKGVEKAAEGRDVDGLLRLAGRVSGDTTVSYAWAACQACENAVSLEVPARALFIRAIMAERERVGNHLGDIGAICNDVGFAFAYFQFGRLRELWLRLNAEIFGHRLMMDCVTFGGVKKDINSNAGARIQEQIILFKKELKNLFFILENSVSLQDRLKTTGVLGSDIAKKIGVVGYVGRASGSVYDLRKDAAYYPYNNIELEIPVLHYGDVAARLKVRADEILISLDLIASFLVKMPVSVIFAPYYGSFANIEGLGLIESWRGELLTYVSFGNDGKVERYFARDPSWLNWPALEHLVHGNIVPDFPVCNKSVNGSYSGHDL